MNMNREFRGSVWRSVLLMSMLPAVGVALRAWRLRRPACDAGSADERLEGGSILAGAQGQPRARARREARGARGEGRGARA
eukprot:CAMPEP_0119366538 /NCGR_PEP_ID=MMETSP1334-20130426/13408_1 /TAXON_ID=127549 /ORGANISM="Calcidiscus leptoporus, Strain RCC1130" /LENGTH=80 /DNA_ID=CAMNT_0007382771 /DNA_START=129 /DNA_END=367 /DNA_ORIENTATION=-